MRFFLITAIALAACTDPSRPESCDLAEPERYAACQQSCKADEEYCDTSDQIPACLDDCMACVVGHNWCPQNE